MLGFFFALIAAITVPPKPPTYVTDNAHVLNAARAHALNEKLAQFERETSNQILVYVDRKLPRETTIEQFANESMHRWGVGQKGKDNGAVLFLFIDDRKMRIEVGYGLEARLTDARARQITSTIIKPHLQKKDYTGAAEAGASAMIETARAEMTKGTGKTVRETKASSPSSVAIGCVLLALIVGVPAVLIFFLIRAIVRWAKKQPSHTSSSGETSDTSSSSSSFWSSSGSSSDSSSSSSSSSSDSSGFDGGGGDSGGGGASDSW
ncbi:MAG: uncharacterized protein QOK37_3303 [Thermoanaerobaculia bacterium]|jgi:uncharacterized protein|nr:uncharacterized protein [Thermoanaerobaculia bacterium]